MENEKQKSKTTRFHLWFKRKHKRADPFHLSEVSDGGEDDSSDYLDDVFVRSMEMDPCISTNELRVFVGTWNVAGRSPVGSLAVDVDEWLNLKDAADIYVLGFQEIVPLNTRTVIGAEDPTEATNWNLLIGKTLNDQYGCPWLTPVLNPITSDNYQYEGVSDSERRLSVSSPSTASPMMGQPNGCSRYKLMASKKMVGVFISVWMKSELLMRYCISSVKVCSVACGIMNYLGNKGSVSVSMTIEGTSFCFIAAHLASGEKKGDEGRRNHQVSEIFKRTSFPRLPQDGDIPHPITILGHDQIFWFGDLNYRLYLEDNLARQLIKKQDWRALQEFDQLRRELEDGGVFQGWKEGNIEFAPTYKYSSSNCNRYSGGLPIRAGEKQRTPAWCDRILWYGKGVKQLSYFRGESKFSDHRPVSALFSIQIEVVKPTNPTVVVLHPIVPTINLPDQIGRGKADEEATSTLRSLIVTDREASPTHMQKF
uniref:Putative DNAse I-like superfamily protein isoform 1 n=1 Tax=Davidia involucrata TaxID=16924 RepID=A0A5B7A8I1_DAVIN